MPCEQPNSFSFSCIRRQRQRLCFAFLLLHLVFPRLKKFLAILFSTAISAISNCFSSVFNKFHASHPYSIGGTTVLLKRNALLGKILLKNSPRLLNPCHPAFFLLANSPYNICFLVWGKHNCPLLQFLCS